MCKFFSCVSDGKGKVSFFEPKDIVEIMANGNERSYDFNSHTSLMHWLGIKAEQEDAMNKWEYNPKTKELVADNLATKDDSSKVKKVLEKFFDGKNIEYIQNLYGRNTGNRNTGNRNTGYGNTGNGNTGYRNTGNWNTGDRNTGNRNTGYGNTGNGNTGYRNSGYGNTGNGNTGNRNTGNWNTGDSNTGYFCTIKSPPMLFNKPCSEASERKAQELNDHLYLTEWISFSDMTKAEKEANEFAETLGGYLKARSYKEAWSHVAEKNPEVINEIKTWENFDSDIFEEITGIKVNK